MVSLANANAEICKTVHFGLFFEWRSSQILQIGELQFYNERRFKIGPISGNLSEEPIENYTER